MSIQEALRLLAEAVGVDIHDVLVGVGNIEDLQMSGDVKALIPALNQIHSVITGINILDDVEVSEASAFSSQKIQALLSTAIEELKSGAPESYDTLKEIADWIAADQTQTTSILTSLNKLLRFDATMSLTDAQKTNLSTTLNLNLAAIDIISIITGRPESMSIEVIPSGATTQLRTIRLVYGGSGDMEIDWGDGAKETRTLPFDISHSYAVSGTPRILKTKRGNLTSIRIIGFTALRRVLDYGSYNPTHVEFESETLYFVPDLLPSITDTSFMFRACYIFNQDISNWKTGNVTNMNNMFSQARGFNRDIGNWDTSKVTNMVRMFYFADKFNQDLSRWDVFLIKTKPSEFDVLTDAWNKTNRQPVWGTHGSH